MKKTAKCLIVLVTMLLFLAGCDSFLSTPIGKILENPRKYADRSVTISGEVTEVFSLMVVRYFVIKDKTGQIAVVTDKPLPRKGTEITVHGMVKEACSMGDQQLLVLVEDSGKKE